MESSPIRPGDVALLLDLGLIHAWADGAGRGSASQWLDELTRDEGRLVVARVYSATPLPAEAAAALHAIGVEPVSVPPGETAEAAVSARMAADAVELCWRHPQLATVVVSAGGGLVDALQLVRRAGRRLVVAHSSAVEPSIPPWSVDGVRCVTYPATPAPADEVAATPCPEAQPAAPHAEAQTADVDVDRPAAPALPGLWTFTRDGVPSVDRLRATLRAIADAVGPPPEGRLVELDAWEELQTLREAAENAERGWSDLTNEQKCILIGLLAARLRHLQAQSLDLGGQVQRVFSILTQYSRRHQPGMVHGLALRHTPKRGSWLEDAHAWHRDLQDELGIASDPATEHPRLLAATRDAVEGWQAAIRTGESPPLAAVENAVRACFHAGIGKDDPKLTRLVLPVFRELKAKEFRALREAAKDMLEEAGQDDGQIGVGEDAADRLAAAVCHNPECQQLMSGRPDAPTPLRVVAPAECEICAGSNDRRAMRVLADVLRRNDVERVLIVGGSPGKREELAQGFDTSGIELKLVDGTVDSSKKEASQHVRWAQLTVIWGGTQLSHKVSDVYTDAAERTGARSITVHRRGIEALCREALQHYRE